MITTSAGPTGGADAEVLGRKADVRALPIRAAASPVESTPINNGGVGFLAMMTSSGGLLLSGVSGPPATHSALPKLLGRSITTSGNDKCASSQKEYERVW